MFRNRDVRELLAGLLGKSGIASAEGDDHRGTRLGRGTQRRAVGQRQLLGADLEARAPAQQHRRRVAGVADRELVAPPSGGW